MNCFCLFGALLFLIAEVLCSQNISYTTWTGNKIDKTASIMVEVREGEHFFRVMQEAADTDPCQFAFTAEDTQWGHYITEIGGAREDKCKKLFWMIYKLDEEPDVNNPPDDDDLSRVGVDDLVAEERYFYLFWLRNVDVV